MEKLEQLCLSYIEPIMTVSTELSLVESINKINEVARFMDLPYPQIIASTEFEPNKSRIMFTGHKDWILTFTKKLESMNLRTLTDNQHGLFISGYGISSTNFDADIFFKLAAAQVPIAKFIRDSKGLLLVFSESQKNKVTQFASELILL